MRTAWDDEREEWYFSIVDVCGVLTESKDPQAYWRKLKQRLKDEGNETVTNCHALKMRATDVRCMGACVLPGLSEQARCSSCCTLADCGLEGDREEV